MIEFKNVSFSYGNAQGKEGIADINLHIPKGQIVLLTGTSGCGKSTILRLINGLAPHFYEGVLNGHVYVDGFEPKEVELYKMAPIVGSVFQNPRTQFYNVDTAGELAFACENQGMSEKEIQSRMERTVKRFHIDDLMNQNIFHLSGGQKQQIACASVDVAEPDIFLLDEPTANLDYEATKKLNAIIALWKEAGKTILIAEHRIAWVWDLCDRLLVLDNGRIKLDYNKKKMTALSSTDLVELRLRSKEEINPLALVKKVDFASKIQIKNLLYTYDKKSKLFNFKDFAFPENQICALVGENGIGKTTLLYCLSGIVRNCKFQVEIDGEKTRKKDLWKRVFLVMQDVNHQLFTESVLDEVLISMQIEDVEKAKEILASVHLEELANRHPVSLSGGQKQRVAIACAVASNKDILLFDEPTSGLDRYHMEQTAKLFQKLKEMGKTVIIVTHDSELIQLCCDAVIPLKEAKNG